MNTETIGSIFLEPLTGLAAMLLHVVQETMQARTWLSFRPESNPHGATGKDGSHEPGKTPRHINLRTV